jgi:hypothetical protein
VNGLRLWYIHEIFNWKTSKVLSRFKNGLSDSFQLHKTEFKICINRTDSLN